MNRESQILVFCPYYPPHHGGLETHAQEFNEQLAHGGISTTTWTPNLPPVTTAQMQPLHSQSSNGVTSVVWRFPAWEIIPNYPLPKWWRWEFWKQWQHLWQLKPKLVLSRTRFFHTSLLALLYAKIKRLPWIHIEHGSEFVLLSSSWKNTLAKGYDLIFGRLIFRNATINIAISEAAQKFVQRFDNRPVPVIHRGIPIDEYSNIHRDTKLKEKYPEKILVTWVGRMYKWKGVDNILKAYTNLPKKTRQKIQLLIIGSGEDCNRLKKQAPNEVIFTGLVPIQRVVAALKATDIYIHASYPGGALSNALLQALYCGTAVIASPHEGANEIIKNNSNGLLLENNSPQHIQAGLEKLICDQPLREKLGKNATKYIVENFQWETAMQKYKRIFSSLEA